MTGETQQTKPLFQRLPKTIVPTHYDVTIQPHLDKFKFNGDVNIHLNVGQIGFCYISYVLQFKVKEATKSVVLYAAELEVDNAKVKSTSSKINFSKSVKHSMVFFCFCR